MIHSLSKINSTTQIYVLQFFKVQSMIQLFVLLKFDLWFLFRCNEQKCGSSNITIDIPKINLPEVTGLSGQHITLIIVALLVTICIIACVICCCIQACCGPSTVNNYEASSPKLMRSRSHSRLYILGRLIWNFHVVIQPTFIWFRFYKLGNLKKVRRPKRLILLQLLATIKVTLD